MGEVSADLPALDRFASRSVGRRDQLEQVRHQMSAVQLPRDAFGYIPGVGGRVHEAYEDFIADCTDVADWATNSVLSLAEAVRNAAAAYAESDQSAAGRLDQTGALHPGVK